MSMENLKKVVGFGLTVGEVIIAAAKASGPLGKAAIMLKLLEDVPSMLGVDYGSLMAEVKALTPEQLDELNVYIDDNFDIADNGKEAMIEAAISVVIDLAKIAEKAVSVWAPKAVEAAPAP